MLHLFEVVSVVAVVEAFAVAEASGLTVGAAGLVVVEDYLVAVAAAELPFACLETIKVIYTQS